MNQPKIIVFAHGERTVRIIERADVRDAAAKVKELRDKGHKIHLVLRTERRQFPPPDEIRAYREQGQMWCPYCGAWRWFTVPKYIEDAEIGSEAWFMNSYHRQDIKVCRWCHIGEFDWWVRNANQSWDQTNRRRTRKKRLRTRR